MPIKAGAFFIMLYSSIFLFNTLSTANALTELIQFIGGTILLFSSGVSVVIILQRVFKRSFDIWEFISLAFVSSLVFFPLIIELESFFFNHVYDWYPLFNVILTFTIAGVLLLFNQTKLPSFPSFKNSFSFTHPLTITLFIFLVLVSIFVLTFRALPDLDPYKWLFSYSYQFSDQHVSLIERPSFGALTFVATRLIGTEIFVFFKYILPFFFVFITLPAWLVARNFEDKKKRLLYILLTFTSPAVLLYGTTAMPQEPFLILSYFFIFFLLYSFITKDSFFYYAAGIVIFLGYFYHQVGIILFAIWALITIIAKRKTIFADKVVVSLVILLLLSHASYFNRMLRFILNWSEIFFDKIFLPNSINLKYPAAYQNIDLNMMGWPGVAGVTKYYAFHMGPVVGAIIIIFLFLFLKKSFRIFVWNALRHSPALIVALGAFTLFFSISEILPRFPNLALLPDRAWVFAGIFSLIPAFFILYSKEKLPRHAMVVSSVLILISMGGALYVNHLKQYLMTPAQWRSAQWIIENLPKERLFLSAGNKQLLPVHAESRLIRLPQSTYCNDLSGFEKIMKDLQPENDNDAIEKQAFSEIATAIEGHIRIYRESLKTPASTTKKYDLLQDLSDNINHELNKKTASLKSKQGVTVLPPIHGMDYDITGPVLIESAFSRAEFTYTLDPKDELYIYYSSMHEKNPYNDRPYTLSSWGFADCGDDIPFIFDKYPERFKRIYDDGTEVIIWKVL